MDEIITKNKMGAPTKIPKERHVEILQQYRDGRVPQEIATNFNVCGFTIRNILKKNGIKLRRGRIKGKFYSNCVVHSKIPYHQYSEIFKRFQENKEPLATIAFDYGISKQALDQLVKRHGITRQFSAQKNIQIDEEPKVIQAYMNNDKNINKTLKTLNIGRTTVVRVLKKHNVEIISHKRKVLKKDHRNIIKKYQKGYFITDIAKAHKVKPSTITMILRKHGVGKRTAWPRKISLVLYPEIEKLHKRGMSGKVLAEKYGVSLVGMYHILRRIQKGNYGEIIALNKTQTPLSL